jgi:glycosidase
MDGRQPWADFAASVFRVSFAGSMSTVYQLLARSSVYEVNLRQYSEGGDFNGFRPHLQRLASMGVGILWFMPLTPISVEGRKGTLGSYYACSDYRSVNPEFGTMDEFREIVREAHALGMKVIVDWVANHTGLDHLWTRTHPDFYKRNAEGAFFDANGWDDVIDLDYSNPRLRHEMKECMRHWLETAGIDGFRCDMAMLTPLDFWREARTALDPGRELFWLAELDPLDHPDYMQVFDAGYTWRWMRAAQDFLDPRAGDLDPLFSLLEHYRARSLWRYRPAWFTSNHDENSWNGTEYEKYGGMALPLAVFSCLWPGMPLIYGGQEIPNRKRLAFFGRDPLEWVDPPALHDFYRRLLTLRKTHPAFDSEMVQPIGTGGQGSILCFLRRNADQRILVILNFSEVAVTDLRLSETGLYGSWTDLFTGLTEDPGAGLSLPGWGYCVLVR